MIATSTFKPAILASARTFKIFDDRIEKWKDDELEDSMDLNAAQSARYVSMLAREYKFKRLDIARVGAKPFQLSINASFTSTPSNDPDLAGFYDAVGKVCSAMETAKPPITVTYGETDKVTKILFGIGLVAVLGSIVAIALAIITDVPKHKFMKGSIAFGALFLFGLQICWSYNPWKQKDVLTWAQLRTRLE